MSKSRSRSRNRCVCGHDATRHHESERGSRRCECLVPGCSCGGFRSVRSQFRRTPAQARILDDMAHGAELLIADELTATLRWPWSQESSGPYCRRRTVAPLVEQGALIETETGWVLA